jgi:hypothetical protein
MVELSSNLTVMDATTLLVLSWNLRFDSKPDSISVAETLRNLPSPLKPPSNSLKGEQPWSQRRVGVVQRILASEVDVFGMTVQSDFDEAEILNHAKGLQEALERQVTDLKEILSMGGEEWSFVSCDS